MRYELVFEGAANPGYKFPRYRRHHRTIESAEATAQRVYTKLDKLPGNVLGQGTITDCHGGIIHGPGCGPSGRAVRRQG